MIIQFILGIICGACAMCVIISVCDNSPSESVQCLMNKNWKLKEENWELTSTNLIRENVRISDERQVFEKENKNLKEDIREAKTEHKLIQIENEDLKKTNRRLQDCFIDKALD